MNEPALTEAVKTDLPSPKPNRRKRLALRFAALDAAVSVLGAAYWFTRPQELVWWRSPAIGMTRRHLALMIPNGWGQETVPSVFRHYKAAFFFRPTHRCPTLLRRIFRIEQEEAQLLIYVDEPKALDEITQWERKAGLIEGEFFGEYISQNSTRAPRTNIFAECQYTRTNLPAFNRTYRQICNSLRIE